MKTADSMQLIDPDSQQLIIFVTGGGFRSNKDIKSSFGKRKLNVTIS
jgi:hypothetical protein